MPTLGVSLDPCPVFAVVGALGVSVVVLHVFMMVLLCLLMVPLSRWLLPLRPLLLLRLNPLAVLVVMLLRAADVVLVGWRAIGLLGS